MMLSMAAPILQQLTRYIFGVPSTCKVHDKHGLLQEAIVTERTNILNNSLADHFQRLHSMHYRMIVHAKERNHDEYEEIVDSCKNNIESRGDAPLLDDDKTSQK